MMAASRRARSSRAQRSRARAAGVAATQGSRAWLCWWERREARAETAWGSAPVVVREARVLMCWWWVRREVYRTSSADELACEVERAAWDLRAETSGGRIAFCGLRQGLNQELTR